MRESEALELLASKSGQPITAETEVDMKAIVKELGYLALAITQAGDYMDK